MERCVNGFCLIFLILFFFLVPLARSQLPPNQRTTMANIAYKLNSVKWNTTDSDPCNWNGVSCSTNSITHLSFRDFGLNSSDFRFDLCNLTSLQGLDLSINFLTSIPTSLFSSCSHNDLKILNFSSNLISGVLPSFQDLGSLESLDLSRNQMRGTVVSQFEDLIHLRSLNLSFNLLYGSVPTDFGKDMILEELQLSNNRFTGVIPEAPSQLQKLLILNLGQNSLTGPIPSTLSDLTKLSSLNLENNELNGSIPDTLVNLNSLTELQLGHNKLSGKIPRMPNSLQLSLNLSSNLFQGSIPSTLAGLSNLEILDLSNNRFTGEVPEFLTGMVSLTMLVLSNNQLSGTLPQFKSFVIVNVTGKNVLIKENPNSTPTILHKKRNLSLITLVTVVGIAGAVFGIGLAMIVVLVFRCFYPSVIKSGLLDTSSTNRLNLNFTSAMEAFADPANIMFKTRFSAYYKAVMPSGMRYSVKVLNQNNQTFQLLGHEKFKDELEILGSLTNSNIMTPVAYILTPIRAYMLYEHIHKGTLFGFLHSSSGSMLNWPCRYSIALGVAQGLAFLHGCTHSILHLDLSSRSILLKTLNEPQLADIELCKIIDPSKSAESLSVLAGSVGYIPPEYPYTMRVTMPGNVYSFGVILLELLTGKPPMSEGIELAKWVLSTPSRDESWEQILDPSMTTTSPEVCNEMLSVLKVALDCVSLSPEERPEMNTVVSMLLTVR